MKGGGAVRASLQGKILGLIQEDSLHVIGPPTNQIFVALCGAFMRSHDSPRQWIFELVEENCYCKE